MSNPFSLFLQANLFRQAASILVALSPCLMLPLPGQASPTNRSAAQSTAQKSARTHFQHGLDLSLKSQYAKAEVEYREAIRLDPKNPTYYSYLSDVLAVQGKFAEAQTANQKSRQLKSVAPKSVAPKSVAPKSMTPALRPAKPPVRSYLPKPPVQTARKPPQPMPKDNAAVSRTSPKSPELSVTPIENLPQADTENTDMDNSGEDEITIVMPPDFGPDGTEKAMEQLRKGVVPPGASSSSSPNDPIESYVEPIDEDPVDPATITEAKKLHDQGDQLFAEKKYAAAESAYRKAVSFSPDNSIYQADLAGALLRQGKRDAAEEEILMAAAHGLRKHWVLEELGIHLIQSDPAEK